MEAKLMNHTQTKLDKGRIAVLRQDLLETTPRVCVERARLVTEAYRENEADPIVLRRAKAFAHTLDHMSVYIQDGDLIVGNQASSPRAAPIFPEYSTDWIENEIDEFADRTADRFLVDPAVKRELLEEMGIIVDVGEELTTVKHAYTHFRITLYAFLCQLEQGEPRCLECQDFRWATLDEIRALPMAVTDRRIAAALERWVQASA